MQKSNFVRKDIAEKLKRKGYNEKSHWLYNASPWFSPELHWNKEGSDMLTAPTFTEVIEWLMSCGIYVSVKYIGYEGVNSWQGFIFKEGVGERSCGLGMYGYVLNNAIDQALNSLPDE